MKSPQGDLLTLSNQYVAGLFDGEGCLSISKRVIKGKHEKYVRYRLKIKITGTDLRVLELLKDWFGAGNIYRKFPSKKIQERKPCYDWVLAGKANMLRFISFIKQYSIIKEQHIKLALEFLATVNENKGSTPLTKKQREIRENIYWEFKKLYNGIESLPSE